MKRGGFYIVLIGVTIVTSCSPERETKNGTLTDYQKEVISYFKDVALGFEFGTASQVTRKWEQEMKVFVGGIPSLAMKDELARIVGELNILTANDNFKISITTDTLQSNCYLFFGTGSEFAKVIPFAASEIQSNLGLFYVYFDDDQNIYEAVIYVDVIRVPEADIQKHLLREELTQSLGLARDSKKYPESIFQQNWTNVTEYAPIDRDLVKLLYDPKMQSGLDENSVESVLEELVVGL